MDVRFEERTKEGRKKSWRIFLRCTNLLYAGLSMQNFCRENERCCYCYWWPPQGEDVSKFLMKNVAGKIPSYNVQSDIFLRYDIILIYAMPASSLGLPTLWSQLLITHNDAQCDFGARVVFKKQKCVSFHHFKKKRSPAYHCVTLGSLK